MRSASFCQSRIEDLSPEALALLAYANGVIPEAAFMGYFGGEGEIRTHEPRKGPPVFKTGAINRSATSPISTASASGAAFCQILLAPAADQVRIHYGPAHSPANRIVCRYLYCSVYSTPNKYRSASSFSDDDSTRESLPVNAMRSRNCQRTPKSMRPSSRTELVSVNP
jgi:hypothetical protein